MRRCITWITTLALALSLALPLAAQAVAPAPPATPPKATAAPTTTPAQVITPEVLWDALLRGNKEYVAGKITYDSLVEERKTLQNGQTPPITVLSCSDSRLPPELVFNQSLGALFVVRTAGNVTDDFGLASIEYAIQKGYTELIVVLGHESCGAVEAAIGTTDPDTPGLLALVQRIRTSFGADATMEQAVIANTRAAAMWLPANSRIIRDAVLAKKVKIVTAVYSLKTGEVNKIE
jgi:carbonic anhydrase